MNAAKEKHIVFLDLDPTLASALSAHLNGFKISDVVPLTSDAPADLILSSSAHHANWPGTARVHIPAAAASRPRLGAFLADIARALTDPAFAVAPFVIDTDTFYPAEKKLCRPDASGATQDILLTERETLLLLCLARHAPRAASRETLLREVWQYQKDIDTHTLETHIYRLRQKIERDDTTPAVLLTKPDGYLLCAISAASPDE